MSRLLNRIPQFFAAETPSGTTTVLPDGPKSGGTEDIIEFLADDAETEVLDITPPAKKAGKTDSEGQEETPEPEEQEEVDELAEIEAELEGPSEEKLELVTPVRRQEILKKYPTIFKDFPQLENSYYRDQQFTEMFGTVKDARMVAEKAQVLDTFEGEIMDGSITNVLKAVKAENPKSFLKLADKYLHTLAEVDEGAYMHVIGNVTKHTIQAMVKEARSSGNKSLEAAATLLNQFVFMSSQFTPPQNLSKESQEEEQQNTAQNEREQSFMRQQFDTAKSDIDTRVNNTLRNTIEAHIDPKESMSPYVRKNAVKDAMETLSGLLEKDVRFKGLTDKLWEKVFEENFSNTAKDRVRSAFLSRAKTLLPSVIKKARNEALRGTGHRVREDEDTTPKRGPVPAGKPRTQQSGKIREAKDIPQKMSTLDFLNSD